MHVAITEFKIKNEKYMDKMAKYFNKCAAICKMFSIILRLIKVVGKRVECFYNGKFGWKIANDQVILLL